MDTLFSILIVNFNNSRFLPTCIDSIICQNHKNWEVIIVDDASIDNSIEVIKKLIKEDKRFRLFQNSRNYGCGYSKNYAVHVAQGKYCAFVDPDDAIKQNAITTLLQSFSLNPRASIISSRHELIDENSIFLRNSNMGGNIKKGSSFLSSYKSEITHMAAFIRNYYVDSGGINPKLKRAVDHDLYFKMEEHGDHVFINQILYSYRIHPNGISQFSNALKARYWAIKVCEDAYHRRLRNKCNLSNISIFQIKNMKSEYFYSKLHLNSNKRSLNSKIYLFALWLYFDPRRNLGQKIFFLINRFYFLSTGLFNKY